MAQAMGIIQFTRRTVRGTLYNEGEKAAFPLAEAEWLVNGGIFGPTQEKTEPCANLLKKLSATEVVEIESKGQSGEGKVEINLGAFNPQELGELKKLLARSNERASKVNA